MSAGLLAGIPLIGQHPLDGEPFTAAQRRNWVSAGPVPQSGLHEHESADACRTTSAVKTKCGSAESDGTGAPDEVSPRNLNNPIAELRLATSVDIVVL